MDSLPMNSLPKDSPVKDSLLDVERLLSLLERYVERWHHGPLGHDERQEPWPLVLANHVCNFQLWHEEDQARDRQADDAQIAQVKRNIDRFNQQRNDAVERLDEHLVAALHAAGVHPPESTPLNSETVGSIVDRLSILSLKVYHMAEEAHRTDADAAHRAKAGERLAILKLQRADLGQCLTLLLKDLAHGTKRLKVYRQMKMYNDPTLNPVLYQSSSASRRP